MRRRHGDQHRRAVAFEAAELACLVDVVARRHEDGAGVRVRLDVRARLAVEREVVLLAPLDHLLRRALQHGDVDRLDLGLLQHLGGLGRPAACDTGGEQSLVLHRRELEVEALQRPAPGGDDLRRHRGQGHHPAHSRRRALVGEAGDVVLDAVVPGDHGGGAGEAHRAVGGDQAAAGRGGQRGDTEQRRGDTGAADEPSQHGTDLLAAPHPARAHRTRTREGGPGFPSALFLPRTAETQPRRRGPPRGTQKPTTVPPPGRLSTLSQPPAISARSRMVESPRCPGSWERDASS